MKKISLTKGKFAIVDDADYEWLSQWKWHLSLNGYACRVHKGKNIMMHREIIKTPKGMVTDHINRDRLDNRLCNLRICTVAQNGFNQGKQGLGKTTSKYRGVWWSTFYQKWEVQIYALRKRIYIGRFDSEIEAAAAYNEYAKTLYGEFAGLNDVKVPEGMVIGGKKKKTSKYKGVYFHTQMQKWCAKYHNRGSSPTYLGSYKTEDEAASAYKKYIQQIR